MTHTATKKVKVAILGGGISGLSLAFFLHKKFGESIDLALFEAKENLGGSVQTKHAKDFMFETGPKSFRCQSSDEILNLCHEIGFSKELIFAQKSAQNRFLFIDQKLQRFPSNPLTFAMHPLTRPLFWRLLGEGFKANGQEEDESVASFFERRLGRSIVNRFVDPMVTGIFAGDPHKLSMKSCFPVFWEDEKKYGSLILGFLIRSFSQTQKKSSLTNFKQGLSSIIQRLHQQLSKQVHLSSPIRSIEFKEKEISITFANHTTQKFDKVISTLPSSALAEILPSSVLKTLLLKGDATSIVSVHLGFKTNVLNYQGFGYLIPFYEKEPILGTVFDSQVFPEHNRSFKTRLTVMMGGVRRCDLLSLSEKKLEDIALNSLRRHLHISQKPEVSVITKAAGCIPQYLVGHSQWVNCIEAELSKTPHLSLIGNSYYGVSLTECVKKAKFLAENFNPLI